MGCRSEKTRQFVHGFVLPGLAVLCLGAAPAPTISTSELRERIRDVAGEFLDQALVSYVYGGFQVGDSDDCKICNDCLAERDPAPKARLKACPSCKLCSLDCSHFAALVFKTAGVPFPYLDTATMLQLSGAELSRRYGLLDLDLRLQDSQPGDFLVYDGHMVILEKRHAPVDGAAIYRGDVVHATGGRVVRGPGEGIQRERFVNLDSFRGPLRRILRHQQLSGEWVTLANAPALTPEMARPPHTPKASPKAEAPKLRPVERRSRR